jgi:hypothetical protein
VPMTQREIRSFVQFCTFYANFINHFSNRSALLHESKPQRIMMPPTCVEAFDTVKPRIISEPFLVRPEVSSDATFTVATYASSIEIVVATSLRRKSSANLLLGW